MFFTTYEPPKQCVYPCHHVGCTIMEGRKEGSVSLVTTIMISSWLLNSAIVRGKKKTLRYKFYLQKAYLSDILILSQVFIKIWKCWRYTRHLNTVNMSLGNKLKRYFIYELFHRFAVWLSHAHHKWKQTHVVRWLTGIEFLEDFITKFKPYFHPLILLLSVNL